MPGGQYTNLCEQAARWASRARWPEIARAYAEVNQTVRRHRQGHADLEGRRRHGAVHGDQRPRPPSTCSTATRARVSRSRSSSLFRGDSASRPAAFRRSCRSKVLQGRSSRCTAGPATCCRRSTWRSAHAELEQDAGARLPRTSSRPTCCIRRCSPILPARADVRRRQRAADAGVLLRPGAGREVTVDIEPGKTLIVDSSLSATARTTARAPCSSSSTASRARSR